MKNSKWRGFYRESRAYMAGTGWLSFHMKLPFAWFTFWRLSREGRKTDHKAT